MKLKPPATRGVPGGGFVEQRDCTHAPDRAEGAILALVVDVARRGRTARRHFPLYNAVATRIISVTALVIDSSSAPPSRSLAT